MITIKEIARQLGMSTTTVSNVIHGKTKEVSKDTIDRVERFLKEVDYVPNINARNLAQNKSKIIGVVIKTMENRYEPILSDPFVATMISGIEKMARESGYFMMLYISDDIDEILKYVTTWNVDGLLLFWMMDDDAFRIYEKYRKPVVCIDTYISEETEAEYGDAFINIGLDDEKGTYDAVKYLISLGHKDIGFMSDNFDKGVDRHRFRGYQKALSEAGIEYSPENLFELNSTKNGIEASLNNLAEKAKSYTAVVCCADTFATMFINTCVKNGLRVPEDISVVGFDDNMLGRLCRPSLTTIHQDASAKGNLATSTLIDMIHGKEPQKRVFMYDPELIIRESTTVPKCK